MKFIIVIWLFNWGLSILCYAMWNNTLSREMELERKGCRVGKSSGSESDRPGSSFTS